MKNLIKTTATATFAALISAVPMASVAMTMNTAPASVFTEVPRDMANGPSTPATIKTEHDSSVHDQFVSPRIGHMEPANVVFPGKSAVKNEIAGRR